MFAAQWIVAVAVEELTHFKVTGAADNLLATDAHPTAVTAT
jgi:hypothetical protein